MATLKDADLFVFGLGYSASEAARQAVEMGATVRGTTRSAKRAEALRQMGIKAVVVPEGANIVLDALTDVTHILISVPPAPEGCPALASARSALANLPDGSGAEWIGYLSSTAVYGDCAGDWIDETRPPAPRGRDAKARLIAEEEWRQVARRFGAAFDILRIAGIYGPGRNNITRLKSGDARAIIKPGQVFNRIHRDDIAGAILATMRSPDGDRLLNLSDGSPCAASEILFAVARMLGLPRPEEVAFDDANLPPAAAGFYAENRRLKNDRLLALPGFDLRYPNWRDAYGAFLIDET